MVQRYAGGPAFYPINSPPPTSSNRAAADPKDAERLEKARALAYRAQAQEGTIANVLQQPRFNYEEYMRNLKLQLNIKSEGTSAGGMSEFQIYILREREAYIKSLNDVSTSFPMYNDNLNSHHKSFNLGSL